MFVDHQTDKKAYFKLKSNLSVKAAAQYGKTGSALGLWDAVGASTAYSYQAVDLRPFLLHWLLCIWFYW